MPSRRTTRKAPVLLFGQDVAKGTTHTRFPEVLQPCFRESCTASDLHQALSPFKPDFVGRSWHD